MPRKAPFTPLLVIFAVLVAWVGFAAYRERSKPREIVPWRTDFTAAQSEAKQQGKPLLLYFTATWCGPCQEMKTTTFADGYVEQAMRNYVPVKLDIDENQQLAMQYGVKNIPHFVILHPAAGQLLMVRTGYLDPQEFLRFVAVALVQPATRP